MSGLGTSFKLVLFAWVVTLGSVAGLSSGASADEWMSDLADFRLPAGSAGSWTLVAQTDDDGADETEPEDAGASAGSGPGDSVRELSKKTADPTGELALIFTQFGVTTNDGDHNSGSDKVAGNIVFQPIIPIPLYGRGRDEWRIVLRPTIALEIEKPIPQQEKDEFNRKTHLTDLNVPLPVAPPKNVTGKWLLAFGPSFGLPTATDSDFGRKQFSAGATAIVGYLADDWMAGVYPQLYFGVADANRDEKEKRARYGNMFYWFWYNVTDSLQVGFNPTIQYDNKAGHGNKWNVPVGLALAKMLTIGDARFRIETGAEYSVIHEDDFGTRGLFKFNIIPIIPRPIKNPIFGGG